MEMKHYEQDELVRMSNGTPEEQKEVMGMCYDAIYSTIHKYCDIRPEYYPLVTLWIMGTWAHDQFSTYPYLFFNAMKGSGKTRMLKLVASMSRKGKLVGNPSEAVLFRTAKGSTFCIDEFESLGSKENNTLRELLNAAYKKGLFIERMKKVTSAGVESYVPEQFDVFCPVAMANIWGMEEVLGDRCISIVIERSNDPVRTRLMETDGFNGEFLPLLSCISVVCAMSLCPTTYKGWNDYIQSKHSTTTLTTLNTHTQHTHHTHTTTLTTEQILLYDRIDSQGISGRSLEIFMPLLMVAASFDSLLLEEVLLTVAELAKEKKDNDRAESYDVMMIEFISQLPYSELDFIPVISLCNDLAEFIGEKQDWLNVKWLGKALKRVGLVVDKVRHTDGRKVRLNMAKAKEMIKCFK